MRVDYECEVCGRTGHRCYAQGKVPKHFFCSRECQNKWQKTREDLILKNKGPEFRKKVSAGLKRRKQLLGDNYHSLETKRKIGATTIEHWENYNDATKEHMLSVLRNNAAMKRTYGPYGFEWKLLSKTMRKNGICHRCGTRKHLIVHHIIPVKCGGNHDRKNLVVLCNGCHTTVENMQKRIYKIIPDWSIIQLLVRERLHCL